MRSWPRHVSPDPALEKSCWWVRGGRGHLGGLLDKELLSACPHLRHQAVEVRQDSLLRAAVNKTTRVGRGRAPEDVSAAGTTGEDTRDGGGDGHVITAVMFHHNEAHFRNNKRENGLNLKTNNKEIREKL